MNNHFKTMIDNLPYNIFFSFEMSGLKEMAEAIRKDFTSFASDIAMLKRKTHDQRRDGIKLLRTKLGRIRNSVTSFEYQIQQDSNMADVDTYKSQAAQYNNNIKKYQKELDFIASDNTGQDNLFEGATGVTIQQQAATGERNAVIQLGRQGQQGMFGALDNIDRDLGQMEHIASNVNIELERQLEALDRIYNTVNDTDSALNRAKKHIKYFARQIYTDKIMMCLIVLIIIAIIVTVIMSIVGVGKGSFFSKT